MARLGDVCNIRGGYAFKSEMFSNNGIPVIRIGSITENGLNIDDNICFSEEFWNNNENYRVNKDDILIAMSGATVGKSCINQLSDRLLLNQRVASVSSKKGVNNSYIYYFVSSPSFMNYVLKQSVGCAQPNISIKQLNDIQLTIPTIDEQNKIVSVLNKATKLIDDRKQQLVKLDELVKARFVEMFGEPMENPHNYLVKRIDEVAKLVKGITYSPEEVCDKDGIVVLRSSNIKGSTFDLQDIVTISKKVSSEKLVKENDILMCNRNGSARLVGKVALIPKLDEDMTFGTFMTIVRSPIYKYLFVFFQTEAFRRQIQFQTAVAINQISLPLLASVTVPIPPKELQNQFAAFVEQVDKTKFAVQKALDEAQTLFNSLMQQYFGYE